MRNQILKQESEFFAIFHNFPTRRNETMSWPKEEGVKTTRGLFKGALNENPIISLTC